MAEHAQRTTKPLRGRTWGSGAPSEGPDLLTRGSLRKTGYGYPKCPIPFSRSHSHDGTTDHTASSTHDRRHATAQSQRGNPKSLRALHLRPSQILSNQPRPPLLGGGPRIPPLLDQRTTVFGRIRQSFCDSGQVSLQRNSGIALAGQRPATMPRSLPAPGSSQRHRGRRVLSARIHDSVSRRLDDHLWSWPARLRGREFSDPRHRLQTHAHPGTAGQREEGPLRHALSPAAGSSTLLVALSAPRRTAPPRLSGRLAFPGMARRPPHERRIAADGLPRSGAGGRYQ